VASRRKPVVRGFYPCQVQKLKSFARNLMADVSAQVYL
jgi:hypothetical protein